VEQWAQVVAKGSYIGTGNDRKQTVVHTIGIEIHVLIKCYGSEALVDGVFLPMKRLGDPHRHPGQRTAPFMGQLPCSLHQSAVASVRNCTDKKKAAALCFLHPQPCPPRDIAFPPSAWFLPLESL
jgi:hypothetical protein